MANLGVYIDGGLKVINRISESSGFPMKIEEHIPTEETVMAMDDTIDDIQNGKIRVFYDINEFMSDLFLKNTTTIRSKENGMGLEICI